VKQHPSLVTRRSLRILVPGAALFMLLSGAAFAAVETENVHSYWDGLWWSLSLMTTVGFVGAAPVTALGKILSAALMLVGFIVLAMTTAAVASLFVREDELPETRRERGFEQQMFGELRELNGRLAAIEHELRRTSGGNGSDAASYEPAGAPAGGGEGPNSTP
jgi:voltage-gated potassium channel